MRRLLLVFSVATIAVTPWLLEALGLPSMLALGIALAASLAGVYLLLREAAIDQATRQKQAADAALEQYRQLEALIGLTGYLEPRKPLPATRGWAASPDVLQLLCETVEQDKPQRVVEAGSGISTLVFAYCLERQGSGKLLALEHQPEHVERVNGWLQQHELSHVAEVVHAPLIDVSVGGTSHRWYELSALSDDPIDLLFVDGPPGNLGPLARYPALPLLASKLSAEATVVLDDSRRRGETEVVRRWCKEQPGFEATHHDLEKGACVLRRRAT